MWRTHLTPTPFTASTMVLLVERARIERARGHDVLPAGRGRIEIVDDHDDAVVLVVDGVADAGGQAVVPEAAVAHDRDRLLVGLDVEGRGRRRSEAVAHRSAADIERRQDREQMAADVAGDVMLARVPAATSFMAAKIGRSGQPMQKPGGRGGTVLASSLIFGSASTPERRAAAARCRAASGACRSRKLLTPLTTTCGVYSPAIGSTSLPEILVWMSRRRRMVLSACSMNSGWPSSTMRIAFLSIGRTRRPRRRSAGR